MLDGHGELVSPARFIPIAERFNLMGRIDCWVVRELLGQIRKHFDHLAGGRCRFAVNLSGASLGDENTLDFICNQLEKNAIPQGMVSFEVTETAAIANLAAADYFIRTLKQSGCDFALDDFGSGLSSFAYLKNLPVDYLKIDGAFVKDIEHDAIDRTMVEAINRVGHAMGIQTIAEFVESPGILEILRMLGVDYAQGYAIGKPKPLVDERDRFLL